MTRSRPLKDIGASVLARLKNHADATGDDFHFVLTRFALERLLYRIECSPHAERFVVKGALLFLVWADAIYRPTRDLDLMALQSATETEMETIFRDICATPVPDDAVRFDADRLSVEPIREDDAYAGLRVALSARIRSAKISLQVDIGFGDAITPAVNRATFPVLLDFPPPELACYPPETVIAEKLDALVQLGMANSRMKDYFDLWMLSRKHRFDGHVLVHAIRNTFRRRARIPSTDAPTGLTDDFADDDAKRTQWKAFLRRSGLSAAPQDLHEVVAVLQVFLLPPYAAFQTGHDFPRHWSDNGPWR